MLVEHSPPFRYPILPSPPFMYLSMLPPSVIMYHLIAVWPCAPFEFPHLQHPLHYCVSTECYKKLTFLEKKKKAVRIAAARPIVSLVAYNSKHECAWLSLYFF